MFVEGFGWGSPVEDFAGSCVEGRGDGFDVVRRSSV